MFIGRTPFAVYYAPPAEGGAAAPAPAPDPAPAPSDRPLTDADFITPDDGDDDDTNAEDDAVPEDDADDDEGDPEEDDADAEDDADDDEDDAEDDGDEDDDEADAEPTLKTIKFGGKEYEVPAELEEGFMLKADHTRKTTELAEARKGIEAQTEHQNKIAALRDGQFQDAANLFNIDQALAQYGKLDWDALNNEDPVEAQRLHFQYIALKDQRTEANQRLHQKAAETARLQQVRLAEQAATTRANLAKKIDGWSEDREEAMAQYAIRLGANEAQLRTTVDEPLLEILHDAYQFDLIRKARIEKAKGKGKPKPKAAKPAAKLKPQRQKGRINPDKMSAEAWVAKRNAEVAKREGRG
jgi:hypothetical protein